MNDLKIFNNLFPSLVLGVLIYYDLKLENADELRKYIDENIEYIINKHKEKLPEGFEYSRKLYKKFKIDPTRYRPSSEALWRRLKIKNDFPHVNPVVDLTNFLSLKYQISYGIYDIDKIEGDIIAGIGKKNDRYTGIGKEEVNLKGKIILRDEIGAFGNPSSDSKRTSIMKNTNNVLQIMFFHRQYKHKNKVLKATINSFKKFFNIKELEKNFI